MDEAAPKPHCQPPIPQIQKIILSSTCSPPSVPNVSHLVPRSRLLAEVVGLCWCQPGMAVLACSHGVKRDQGRAVRMEKSAVGFICHASWFRLNWKSWAFLFLSLCLLSSCLILCFGPVCLHLSASIFLPQPQISCFSQSLSLNNVFNCAATGLLLALLSLSLGEC